MNEDARKKVNIDTRELDDDQLSQAVGGEAGSICATWCKTCNCSTLHTELDVYVYRCNVCGTERPMGLPSNGGVIVMD